MRVTYTLKITDAAGFPVLQCGGVVPGHSVSGGTIIPIEWEIKAGSTIEMKVELHEEE